MMYSVTNTFRSLLTQHHVTDLGEEWQHQVNMVKANSRVLSNLNFADDIGLIGTEREIQELNTPLENEALT